MLTWPQGLRNTNHHVVIFFMASLAPISPCHALLPQQCSAAHRELCQGRQACALLCCAWAAWHPPPTAAGVHMGLTPSLLGCTRGTHPHCWGAHGVPTLTAGVHMGHPPSLLADPGCPCCVTENQTCLSLAGAQSPCLVCLTALVP